MYYDDIEFSTLLGKTLVSVDINDGGDEILFVTDFGDVYKLYHRGECCELVYVEDVVGDLNNLIGRQITMAEEVSIRDENPDGLTAPEWHIDSFTWTFYKLATIKGYVTIRWYGSSNGYYSESVDFRKVA